MPLTKYTCKSNIHKFKNWITKILWVVGCKRTGSESFQRTKTILLCYWLSGAGLTHSSKRTSHCKVPLAVSPTWCWATALHPFGHTPQPIYKLPWAVVQSRPGLPSVWRSPSQWMNNKHPWYPEIQYMLLSLLHRFYLLLLKGNEISLIIFALHTPMLKGFSGPSSF